MALLTRIGPGRTAGLIYLIVIATGIISLAFVPSQLIVSGDTAKTVENIAASQGLFRIDIASGFICYVAFLFLPLAFYRLLSHVSQSGAMLMVLLAIVSVPIALGNLVNKLDVLTLLSGKAYLAHYSVDQLNAAVMLSLARYDSGVLVAKIFWGLWLLPLGYLVFRSDLLPKVLGILLMLGCFGYLVDVFGATLFSEYPATNLARFARAPASIGEIGTCLWLVIFGASKRAESVG
ncbi:MAG TPA: DUF4386 domain-containing protein [Steroidobacteraceae bacterium]|nr:DUF4386 domain-containing protein [Steroidobacteraceae bacterium]